MEKLKINKEIFSCVASAISELNEDEQEAVTGYSQFKSRFYGMYLGEEGTDEYNENSKVLNLIFKYIDAAIEEELKHKRWLDNIYTMLTGQKVRTEEL